MIIDARSIAENETLDCDICIVGAGAAGITLALEFLNQDVKVLLLESGGIKYDANLDVLNQGEVNLATHSSLEENRRRQLGGVTTVWGGRCVPFDASDFEYQSHVPYSGWPITKKDLDPYYELAHKYCELGDYNYAVDGTKSIVPGLNSANISTEQIYLFSPPTDFGKRYLNVLKNAPNITLLLNANCLKIATDETGNNVDYLDVASLRRNNFQVRAKQYVLATGGLEVTRLLLVSNDVHKQGIGNRFGLLGRYYMGHLNSYIKIKFAEKVPVIWDYQRFPDGLYYQHSIAIREEKRQEDGLLNQRFFVERPNFIDPSHQSSVLSATYLAKSLLKKQNISQDLPAHLKNIIFDPQGTVGFAYKWITQRILSYKKLPSVIIENKSNLYTFRIDSEQIPNPNSLVSLSESKDNFGINQLKVDWRLSELDIFSVEKSVEILKQAVENTGLGKVVPGIRTSAAPQGGHHLGTTRMSSTPETGVVDANCKVHDVSNLYIASSSVFTTSSYANPTLTVVALTVRLADHIKQSYKK
ncbi:GMC family oxidoreductase [Tolypothrix sp. FACHB-123]|uniref:GMC oxidoreductase n=1 Tax=Tolypothrix sp. FACHB-123 TaxID=2692868 RepID=UPI001687BD49|nr:GMC family oxidoreductase [Tolypothrix sp. FACHB-123]MBD2354432.1 GMC family oxidoreductase [Tolypothrix sp. FACHB-123]